MFTRVAAAIMIAGASLEAQTQQAAVNPMSTSLQRGFGLVADYLVRSAEALPEEKYGFQAAPTVRTFAQEIAHVTDAHFLYCSRARNEASPQQGRVEGSVTDKATLVAKLKESVAFCKAAYDASTDASLSEMLQVGTARGTKFAALVANVTHDNEHYGKVVTYLRMNGMVPPSSQPRQ